MKVLLAWLVALSVATPAAACPTRWSSLFVFGDSYSDSGAGYVDGNGPTAVVYMARALKIPFTHWGAPDSRGAGINFAVSGARTGAAPGQVRVDKAGWHIGFLERGMAVQVEQFASALRQGTIRFDPATTMFFLAGGLNEERGHADQSVANVGAEITRLYALGGRHFTIALIPEAIPQFPVIGGQLNPAYAALADTLGRSLPGARVSTSDWGRYFDRVYREPARYGFTNTADACAGRALLDEAEIPCAAPERHYFYHAGHPATAVHRIVGGMLAREARARFAATHAACKGR